jgi:hypothetical protein
MALPQVTFDKRKWILNCYWKTENMAVVQKRWINEFVAGGGYSEYL